MEMEASRGKGKGLETGAGPRALRPAWGRGACWEGVLRLLQVNTPDRFSRRKVGFLSLQECTWSTSLGWEMCPFLIYLSVLSQKWDKRL